MTLGDLAIKARAMTHTDTVNYTDAHLLIDFNIRYQMIGDAIMSSQDSSDFDDQRATDYPVQTTPMVASRRDYRIPVSERMLKIKRCDISYDGTNAYRAEPLDTGSFPMGIKFSSASSTDTNFDQNFSKSAPRYDSAYNSVFIAPMPSAADVTAGGFIRLEWERAVTPFTTADYTSVLTDSTVVPGFDLSFHGMLALGAAIEKARAELLPQLQDWENAWTDWEARLRAAYGRKDLDTRPMLVPDTITNIYS